MDEVVKEFLIESHENLNQLDHDLIELEKDPSSANLLGSVFRTIHSIKGVSGFLDFPKLEALTHAAEELLSKLRDGKLILNQGITSVLLATVDAVRQMLARIEADGNDGDRDYADIVARLAALRTNPRRASPRPPLARQQHRVRKAAAPVAPPTAEPPPATSMTSSPENTKPRRRHHLLKRSPEPKEIPASRKAQSAAAGAGCDSD